MLATLSAGVVVGLGGCVAGGRVVHEKQKSVTVPPHRGWVTEITDVDGKGAVSYTVRAEQRFDVYYFTARADYERYDTFVGGDTPEEMPSGHSELSQGAVRNEERELFEVKVPDDGGRKNITAESTHYFVVDHSNYGMGVPVADQADPLSAFVDLTAYNNTAPI